MDRLYLLFVSCLLLVSPLAGCMGSEVSEEIQPVQELQEVDNPCSEPSELLTQSTIAITVNNEERVFRLSAPSSDAGTKLALIIAFHGGDGSDEDFQQQSEFDQLGELSLIHI